MLDLTEDKEQEPTTEPTEEEVKQLAAEQKAKDFADNPDDFININDCLVIVDAKRNEEGRCTHYRMKANIYSEDEAHIAKGRATMIIDSTLMRLLQKKSQSIIQPASVAPKQRGAFGGIFKGR